MRTSRQAAICVVIACFVLSGDIRSPALTTVDQEIADLIIRATTVIDSASGSATSNVDVVVRDGVITDVSAHRPERKAVRSIDGSGKYVIPGLMDAHTHPFPVDRSFAQFIQYGVTSILITGCGLCSDERLNDLRAIGEDVQQVAPRVFHTSQHFTMEGRHPVKTYPGPNWVEGKTVFFLREMTDIKGLVDRVASHPNVGIKLTIERGPLPPFVDPMPEEFVTEVVKRAHSADIRVYAHISDSDGLKVVHQAKADHLLHFTGVNIDWDEHRALIDDLVSRDLHWVTTLMLDKSFIYPLNPDWIEDIARTGHFDVELKRLETHGISAALARRNAELVYGEPDPTFATNKVLQKQFDDLRRLHAAGIKFVTGTDVGNRYILPGYSLHEEMSLLEQGGFTPMDVLQMATINAAELVGAAHLIGSVETGKLADLVVLGSDPRKSVSNISDIDYVIKGGNPLHLKSTVVEVRDKEEN